MCDLFSNPGIKCWCPDPGFGAESVEQWHHGVQGTVLVHGGVAPGSPSGHGAPQPQGTSVSLASHPGRIIKGASFTVWMEMWQLWCGSLVPQLLRGRQVTLWSDPTHPPVAALPGVCLASVCSVVFHHFLRLQCIFGKASCMFTGLLKVLMPNISLSAAGTFAGFAGLFTGLKPLMTLWTHSTVTGNSSYPVLSRMWCEFQIRKFNKLSQAVQSLSVYWFKWIFKTPRRQLHVSKGTLTIDVKELERSTK